MRSSTFSTVPRPVKLLFGAHSQESGLRSGTENLPYYAAMAAASALFDEVEFSDQLLGDAFNFNQKAPSPCPMTLLFVRHLLLKFHLLRTIESNLPPSPNALLRLNGCQRRCLPQTSSLSFRAAKSVTLVSGVSSPIVEGYRAVACSSGAACHSGSHAYSHVLFAMNAPEEFIGGTLRLSFGKFTTADDLHEAGRTIAAVYLKAFPLE